MKLVLVFNFCKCYRVNLVFPFHDVFLSVFFFIINKLCYESARFFAENVFLIQSFTRHPRASAILIVRISGFIAANIYCVLIQTLQFQTMTWSSKRCHVFPKLSGNFIISLCIIIIILLNYFFQNKFINLYNPHIAKLIGAGCMIYNKI